MNDCQHSENDDLCGEGDVCTAGMCTTTGCDYPDIPGCCVDDFGCPPDFACDQSTNTCESTAVPCFSISQHLPLDPLDPDPVLTCIEDCEARAGCPLGVCGAKDDAGFVSIVEQCLGLGGFPPDPASCDQIDQLGISNGCENIVGAPACPPEPEGCLPPPPELGSCPCWDGGPESVPGVTSVSDLWAQLGPDQCDAPFTAPDRCTDGRFSDCTTVTIAQCRSDVEGLFKTTVRDDFLGGPGPRCEVNASALFPLIGSVGFQVSGLTPEEYHACLQEHDEFTVGVSIPTSGASGVNQLEDCGLGQEPEPEPACASSPDGTSCDADGVEGTCQSGECVPDDATVGDEFVLVFQNNDAIDVAGPPTLSLFISGSMATNGVVEIGGLGFSQPFSVVPGAITTVTVPTGAMISTSDVIEADAAMRVMSDNQIRIYGLNRLVWTTDAFAALPIGSLGQQYRVMAWPGRSTDSDNRSQFAIAATEDGTSVIITPKATSGTRTSGVPYTITLNQFDAYQLVASGDLTGTLIESDAPIAVFGGHQCGYVPSNYNYCDHLVEQMPPIDMWGTGAMTVPLATRSGGDYFRILASQDNTTVVIDGPVPSTWTLNAGQRLNRILDGNNSITADAPILVAQYSTGSDYDGAVADPFMMLLPPAQQFLRSYTFTTPSSGFPSNFVNVIALATDAAGGWVLLDGIPVGSGLFTPMPGALYSGAQVPVSLGAHTLEAPSPLGLYVYGYADYDSYGYSGGFSAAP